MDPVGSRVWSRLRRWRPLVLFAVLVLAGTTVALAATGVFRAGSPVSAAVPATPDARAGVAVAGSVRVLALRFADPGGGPPWGLRIARTTRGLVCVQPGRVEFGQVGALGIDGALDNDGRFHPFSANYLEQFGCGRVDGHGHAFTVATLHGVPASAIEASCTPPSSHRVRPLCPPGALRDISYGMFGPDAVSVTYADPTGRLTTIPTAGPDGAFLVISRSPSVRCTTLRAAVTCADLYDSNGLDAGVIRRVTYRSGHTCILRIPTRNAGPQITCPRIGYVPPPAQHVTSTEVATPITVRNEGLQYFCPATTGGAKPCGATRHPATHRLPFPPEYVLVISFIARVAVHNVDSHYTITIHDPGPRACGGGGRQPGEHRPRPPRRPARHTASLRRARCNGTFHIVVTYNAPGARAIPVGHTTITLARRNHA